MHLVYLDESGNTGMDLNNPHQPVFTLCAMIVKEEQWQPLEQELKAVLDARFPQWRTISDFEMHGTDLRTGRAHFRGIPVADRIALRDGWMDAGAKHQVRLIFRSVHKKRYADWMVKHFGAGVSVNPHVAAFALLARSVDNYLASEEGPPLGVFISDDNKDVSADVEKSINALRGAVGTLRLSRIIEKGFFIESGKSLPLQLCDLFTLSARKLEERRHGGEAKSIDDSGIEFVKKLRWTDNQHDVEVLEWLTGEGKKEAARG